MSLAEPLLTAARRLLESIATGQKVALPTDHQAASPAPSGLFAARVQVGRALAIVQRMSVEDDRRLLQVESLLADAERAVDA